MNILSIKYKDGSSEEISNAYTVVDHGDGEISFFIGGGWMRHYAEDVESFTVSEAD